jgi:molybdopterin-binding protein
MDLLSAHEVARYLRLNVKRVQALARAGRLPGRRVGRKWLFDRRDLDQALGTSSPPDVAGIDLSARNQLRGRIVALTLEGVMAEVTVSLGDQQLVSVITSGSAARLGLRIGDAVLAVIKSTEIMIGKESSSR